MKAKRRGMRLSEAKRNGSEYVFVSLYTFSSSCFMMIIMKEKARAKENNTCHQSHPV